MFISIIYKALAIIDNIGKAHQIVCYAYVFVYLFGINIQDRYIMLRYVTCIHF